MHKNVENNFHIPDLEQDNLKKGRLNKFKKICHRHLSQEQNNVSYFVKDGTKNGVLIFFPSYILVYCKNPAVEAPLENGIIYKRVNNGKFQFQKYITTIRHGTRLLFICDPGFIRKGPSGATCVNGTWSPSIDNPGTKCEEQNHPEFPKLWMAEEEKNSEIP